MHEEWRWIKDYEGAYEISSYGQIRTYRYTSPIILRTHLNRSGYPVYSLSPRKGKTRMIHRMVAEAFIPNPNGLPIVHHKDGNRANPHVSNLQWVTASENTKEAYRSGKLVSPLKKFYGERAMSVKLTEGDVSAIRAAYEHGEKRAALARKYGMSYHAITDIITRHSWKHI